MSKCGAFPAGVSGFEREIIGHTRTPDDVACRACGESLRIEYMDHIEGSYYCVDCSGEIHRLKGELEEFGLGICEAKK